VISKFKNLQKYSGVLGVTIIVTGVVTAMHHIGLGFIDARPISYLGVDTRTAVLFSGSLLLSALLFISFAFHVTRSYSTGSKFKWYFIAGQIGQMIAALVPYSANSTQHRIHTSAAFALAFTLPLLIWQFARSQKKSKNHRLFIKLLRLEQVTFVVGIGLFIFTKGIAPLGEILPTLGFYTWIFVLTFLPAK
jgi:hypothetical protein